MKYLVMETHKSYAVVLDEEGAFKKVANFGYNVGDKVDYILEMNVPVQVCEESEDIKESLTDSAKEPEVVSLKKRQLRKVIAAVSALAACCVLMVTTLFNSANQVYASVLMSINPQVNIDINKDDIVVGIDGRNEDGEVLIDGYKYKHKELEQVMDELIERAVSMGFLKKGGKITLELNSDDDEWLTAKGIDLQNYLDKRFDKDSGIKSAVNSRIDYDDDDENDDEYDVEDDEENKHDDDERYEKDETLDSDDSDDSYNSDDSNDDDSAGGKEKDDDNSDEKDEDSDSELNSDNESDDSDNDADDEEEDTDSDN